MKLVKKVRVGSKLRRVYEAAQTPLDRVLASPGVNADRVAELKALRDHLDPFQLAHAIDRKLQRIYALAHPRLSPRVTNPRSATE